jgi:phage replication-related protein YjqB (UPF0714/DUF867 family)
MLFDLEREEWGLTRSEFANRLQFNLRDHWEPNPGCADMGKYGCYAELECSESKGCDYQIHIRKGTSGIALMAIHGGEIEPGTLEIAGSAAGDEHSFYAFEGTKEGRNSDLHLRSDSFDEPVGVSMAQGADVVVTIHGCEEDIEVIYLGGLHKKLKWLIQRNFSLCGFYVPAQVRPGLAGTNPLNICNRGRTGKGVQIEISRGLRRKMFSGLDRKGRGRPTETFFSLISALRSALDPTSRLGRKQGRGRLEAERDQTASRQRSSERDKG